MRSTRSIERHGTSSVMTQWAVCAVAMKVTDTVLHTREERLEQQRAPTQEPSKQHCVSQIGETWRGTTSEKFEIVRGA